VAIQPIRPRVFVSSTIYDLADLRSAAKFWLEEMGYDVQMSEYNDFARKPELSAFDECFEAVRACDYYVLIVGDRRGAWFDEPQRISVTQKEYLTAREAFIASGKRGPKLVCLVRESVQTALRERQAMTGRTSASRSRRRFRLLMIASRALHRKPRTPDSTLQDPEFTAEFLRQVGQREATGSAARTGTEFPVGNWVSSFSGYRDFVDAIRNALNIRAPLARGATLESVRAELERNLRLSMNKTTSGRIFYKDFWLRTVPEEVQVTGGDLKQGVILSRRQFDDVLRYLLAGTIRPDTFAMAGLDQAIRSGALLDFDPSVNRFVSSDALGALYKLRDELGVYERRYEGVEGARQEWYQIVDRVQTEDLRGAEVSGMALMDLLALHDTQRNIRRLMLATLRHIYGHTTGVDYQLRRQTPLADVEEEIRAEQVSEAELGKLLLEDNIALQTGTVDVPADHMAELTAMLKDLENPDPEIAKRGADAAKRLVERVRGTEEADTEPPADTPTS